MHSVTFEIRVELREEANLNLNASSLVDQLLDMLQWRFHRALRAATDGPGVEAAEILAEVPRAAVRLASEHDRRNVGGSRLGHYHESSPGQASMPPTCSTHRACPATIASSAASAAQGASLS
jgi:hypothetical protein